jgi:hypothetical protein
MIRAQEAIGGRHASMAAQHWGQGEPQRPRRARVSIEIDALIHVSDVTVSTERVEALRHLDVRLLGRREGLCQESGARSPERRRSAARGPKGAEARRVRPADRALRSVRSGNRRKR